MTNFNYARFPPSTIRVEGNVAYVSLANTTEEAVVDVTDVPLVEGRRWRRERSGSLLRYVVSCRKGRYVLLHNAIHGYRPGLVTDHADGDILNNRRANLRHCSTAENNFNRRMEARNKTGLKGVVAIEGGFRAQIRARGETFDLGVYRTREEASASYCGAAIVLHGAYANFMSSVIVKDPRKEGYRYLEADRLD